MTTPQTPVESERTELEESLAFAAIAFRAAVNDGEPSGELAEWFSPNYLVGVAALIDQVIPALAELTTLRAKQAEDAATDGGDGVWCTADLLESCGYTRGEAEEIVRVSRIQRARQSSGDCVGCRRPQPQCACFPTDEQTGFRR